MCCPPCHGSAQALPVDYISSKSSRPRKRYSPFGCPLCIGCLEGDLLKWQSLLVTINKIDPPVSDYRHHHVGHHVRHHVGLLEQIH